MSNENSCGFDLPKNDVCKFSYFLFKRVENGFMIITEKSPIRKNKIIIGESICHNETPDDLEIT